MSRHYTWKMDPKSAAPPIIMDAEEAAKCRFCFMGEFGYEMISWMPYLLFLKNKLGVPIRTMGRVGSSVFYNFSDDHIELNTPPGDCWGELDLYQRIAAAHPEDPLIHPGPEAINRRTIVIGGYDWRNRDIHGRIDSTHYATLDYSSATSPSPGTPGEGRGEGSASNSKPAPISGRTPTLTLPRRTGRGDENGKTSRPTVVINNKFFVQWPYYFDAPINFIDRDSLITLRDLLDSRGYDVIYNHYVEKTAYDKHHDFDDEGIFQNDLRASFARCRTIADRNRLQLATFNSCKFVIGPQGGNLYLPAICRRDLFIVQRVGNYLDYSELGKLYGVNVEMFYEPRHMISWLERALPSANQDNHAEAA